jgi:hypothetical protein
MAQDERRTASSMAELLLERAVEDRTQPDLTFGFTIETGR